MDGRHRSSAPPVDPQEPDEASPDEASEPGSRSADTLVRTLPVAGFSRRRLAFVVGALVTAWVVVVFARQVGDAAAATGRVETAAVENGSLTQEVAALQRELDLVQTTPYIVQQARGFGLGARGEIPFHLAADAPPLPSDAPGSAALRLGAPASARSPLDSWLTLLFGSSR